MECNPISPVSPGLASVSSPHLTFGHLPAVQQIPQIRDPEWLKVEVCREFQRGMCTRTDECRYAHPDKHIQITDGKVTACFDALKGRCNRESCKYLHPTHLLKQHLEFNGRQTLLHNRAMLQQMLPIQPNVMQAVQPGSLVGYEQVAGAAQPATLTSLHPNLYAHTAAAGQAYSVLPTDLSSLNHHLMYYPVAATPTHHPHQLLTQHHLQQHPHQQVAAMLPSVAGQRADKLEVCRDFQRGNCTRGEFECRYGHPPDRSMIDTTDNTVTVCMDCIKGRCTRDKCKYFHPPAHLQAKIRAAQNPAVTATMLPSMSPAAIASPQPVVLSNGGGALGQPPLKRHALESASIITSSGSSPGLACPSPTMSLTTQHHASSTQSSLAALYGYPAGLTSMSMPQAATPTAYYQQAMPMLQLYGTGSTLQSAGQAAAQASGQIAAAQSGTAHQLLNLQATLHQQHSSAAAAAAAANTNGSSAAPSYALLDARNQLAASLDEFPTNRKPQQPPLVAHQFPDHNHTALTVCRDFQSGKCSRPFCRFVHVQKDFVEIKDDKVVVCRDALQGACHRPQCKFYHFPSSSGGASSSKMVVDAATPLDPAADHHRHASSTLADSYAPLIGLFDGSGGGGVSGLPPAQSFAVLNGAPV